uniref:GPI inositol-deacylase n=1 Tax=Eutreptiella gymnastica TaxID=73025 RepID=A0A7S1IG54_9EUGL|mmetsp:Transcript_15785/g.27966  ORF Transcript_15785/g.27966 Transcript_15785/m.27966 type:complete len:466 (+) Transcript_15785:94-1491(+)
MPLQLVRGKYHDAQVISDLRPHRPAVHGWLLVVAVATASVLVAVLHQQSHRAPIVHQLIRLPQARGMPNPYPRGHQQLRRAPMLTSKALPATTLHSEKPSLVEASDGPEPLAADTKALPLFHSPTVYSWIILGTIVVTSLGLLRHWQPKPSKKRGTGPYHDYAQPPACAIASMSATRTMHSSPSVPAPMPWAKTTPLDNSSAKTNHRHQRLSLDATLGHEADATFSTHALILPGFLSGSQDYESFADSLRQRQRFASVSVLPIRSFGWWPTLFGGCFSFYLNALEKELTNGHGDVTLICHSAGGWLARLYLGLSREGRVYDGRVYAPPSKNVKSVVTLGTPHYSTESYPFGRVDERRKGEDRDLPPLAVTSSLQLTNHLYDDPSLLGCPITSVFGGSIQGQEGNNVGMFYQTGGCAQDSYGDGMTPLEIAVANGSAAVEVECTHGAGEPGWYGSNEGIDQWIDCI